jgi:hypothetical protein
MIRRRRHPTKTLDFRGKITPHGQIAVPPEIALQVPAGETIEVVLRLDVPDELQSWQEAGRRPFEAAYGPDDSVYDELMHDPSAG